MSSALPDSNSDPNVAVKLLLIGVAIVIAAQLVPGVPIGVAVALLAWGTALTLVRRRGWLLVAAACYAVLGVLVISAQVDLAIRSPSPAWGLLIAVDGAAAAMLLYGLLQQLGEWVAADGSR
jgi:hypothetical protein